MKQSCFALSFLVIVLFSTGTFSAESNVKKQPTPKSALQSAKLDELQSTLFNNSQTVRSVCIEAYKAGQQNVNCAKLSDLVIEELAKSSAERIISGQLNKDEFIKTGVLTASVSTMIEKFCICGKVDAKNGSDYSDVLKLGSLLMTLEQ